MVISCDQSGVTATVDLLKLGMFGMRGDPNAVQGSISRASKTLAVVKTDYLHPSFDTAIAVRRIFATVCLHIIGHVETMHD